MKSDKQWAIEEDARTLVESEMIKKDSKRLTVAVAHIKKENAARSAAIKK